MANTIWNASDKSANVTLTGSNLIATASGASAWVRAVDKQVTGKFYWECKPTVWGNGNTGVGFCTSGVAAPSGSAAGLCAIIKSGVISMDGSASGSTLGARAANDVIGIAVDFTNRLAWFRVAAAGNWNGSATADPATGAGGLSTAAVAGAAIAAFPLAVMGANLDSVTANFGGSAFIGAVPAGFTSGFTSGATPPNSVVTTQSALEEWAPLSPIIGEIYVTQTALEEWAPIPAPPLWVTQVGVEEWASANPPAWVTQIGVEQWASVAPAYDPYWSNVVLLTGGNVLPGVATWDAATATAVTLSGGNLIATNTGTTSTNQGAHVASIYGKTTGKHYFEYTLTTYTGGAGVAVGIGSPTSLYSDMSTFPPGDMSFVVGHTGDGPIWASGGNSGFSLGTRSSGNVIGVAVDFTNSRVWFRVCPSGFWNGSSSADPTATPGAGGGVAVPAGALVPFVTFGSGISGAAGVAGNVITANFGASAFVGAVPSGFTAGWLALGGPAADASTTFIDESRSAKTLTANGDAQIDTAQSKFGGSSLLFDGTGDYVAAADSADWFFGAGQFTIECFARFSAHDGTVCLLSQWGATTSWAFWWDAGNIFFRGVDSGGITRDTTGTAFAPTLNQWYHLAVDRDGNGDIRVYRDGVMLTKNTGYTYTLRDGNGPLDIGTVLGFPAYDMAGWLDEVRITKGVARYANDSAFPVPSAAFPRSEPPVSPALVTDADAFFAPTLTSLAAGPVLLPTLVSDADAIYAPAAALGPATLSPALVSDADAVFSATATGIPAFFPSRVIDAETVYPAESILAGGPPQPFLPGRVTDVDAFPVPRISYFVQSLGPALVVDPEAVYPAYSIEALVVGKDQKLRAPRLGIDDVVYAARFPRTPLVVFDADTIFAPIGDIFYPLTAPFVGSDDNIRSPFIAMVLLTQTVAAADVFYTPIFKLFLLPVLTPRDDAIPAADVGRQVITQFIAADDAIFGVNVSAYNDVLPETWFDEETIETYPFFIQQVTGGIPVVKPVDLVGSIARPRQLIGNINKPRQLKGSMTHR